MLDAVAKVLKTAAAEIVLPRYQSLSQSDIQEKTPGDIVTIADREAEAFIAAELSALMPNSRVVGEEACAQNPALLEQLNVGTIWLVDPIDGTSNFAAGRGPFAIMAALLENGDTVASWMFDPLTHRCFRAERGSGAFLDQTRLKVEQSSPGPENLCGVVATRFMPPNVLTAVKPRLDHIRDLRPLMLCAGAEYPDIALGDRHFALYWRTLPWDHAPGALFLAEAGGCVARPDGSAFKLDGRMGLLAARNRSAWHDAASVLLAG